MDSVQTQTLSIQGDGGGEAYINFCNGSLCVSVVVEGKQADFHFDDITLNVFAYAYKLHCEECKKKGRKTNNERRIIMEVKNGIIIDGVLHEAVQDNIHCASCSLYEKCAEVDYTVCITDLFSCGGFINRGKVTDIKIDKEE